jgi:hypothetical protein
LVENKLEDELSPSSCGKCTVPLCLASTAALLLGRSIYINAKFNDATDINGCVVAYKTVVISYLLDQNNSTIRACILLHRYSVCTCERNVYYNPAWSFCGRGWTTDHQRTHTNSAYILWANISSSVL